MAYRIRFEEWGIIGYSPRRQLTYHRPGTIPLEGNPGELAWHPSEPELPISVPPDDIVDISGPIVVGFPIVDACNLMCRYCFAEPSYSRESIRISDKELQLVERIAGLNPVAVWVSGGEPTLAWNLVELLETINTFGIPVAVDSNGTRLTSELISYLKGNKLASIRITLDAADPQVHNMTRGLGSRTLKGIDAMASAGVTVIVNTVITRYNVSSLAETYLFLSERGVAAWVLYQLVRAGWATDTYDKLDSSDDARARIMAAKMGTSSEMLVHMVKGNETRSTVLVNGAGDLYTIHQGAKLHGGNLFRTSAIEAWRNLEIDLRSHTKKYLALERV